MMKIKVFTLAILLILPLFAVSQEKKEEPKFGINLSGFVKTDIFYDSRQTINIREGHFTLYPDNEKLDLEGIDINDKDQFGILSIQSRITGKITGPDVLGAKTSALIEADFFGNESAAFNDGNGFRLRHAFLKLNWATTEFLVGQYWHPLFVPECFPDVVSFNTGVPFQPFSRNPQIRISQKLKDLKFIFAVAEQRDFTSTGPDGANSKYLKNAVMPDLNFHIQYARTWSEKNEFLIGFGSEFKKLVPRLSSQVDKNLKDGVDTIYYVGDENISSYAISMYSKLRLKDITIKAHAILGNNLYDMVMLGGYAVSSITDAAKMKYDYAAVKNVSLWADFTTNGKVQFGIFGGYTKNLGTNENNYGLYYSRGSNINHVYRVSPRVIANIEKLRIAAEYEYTAAQYGKANAKGIVDSNLKTIVNNRILLAFYYFF